MDYPINVEKITNYCGLGRLVQKDKFYTELAEKRTLQQPYNFPKNAYTFGIEVEVENVPLLTQPNLLYWNATHDGSLRNDGIEFVSVPLKAKFIPYAMEELQQFLRDYQPDFSPRTSIHVHMNARDLTISQIFNTIILYTTVENLLFQYIGHDRDKNVFCIKITETDYVNMMIRFLENPRDLITSWSKYTALNIVPLDSKGTLEFRHMHGNLS